MLFDPSLGPVSHSPVWHLDASSHSVRIVMWYPGGNNSGILSTSQTWDKRNDWSLVSARRGLYGKSCLSGVITVHGENQSTYREVGKGIISDLTSLRLPINIPLKLN